MREETVRNRGYLGLKGKAWSEDEGDRLSHNSGNWQICNKKIGTGRTTSILHKTEKIKQNGKTSLQY